MILLWGWPWEGAVDPSPACDMINAVARTKPTPEELRDEVNELRSTAARLIDQASRLMDKCAELEDLISRGTPKPTKS